MIALCDQLTSVDLSKKIKELGIEQDSFFYWVLNENKEFEICKITELPNYQNNEHFSAFSIPELKDKFIGGRICTFRQMLLWSGKVYPGKNPKRYLMWIFTPDDLLDGLQDWTIRADKEADALAVLWTIWKERDIFSAMSREKNECLDCKNKPETDLLRWKNSVVSVSACKHHLFEIRDVFLKNREFN